MNQNSSPQLLENEEHNSNTWSRGSVLWFNMFSCQTIWNNSRRVKTEFFPWASLIERIQESQEMLQVHYGKKVLPCRWRIFYRMKVLWRHTPKRGIMRGTTRSLLGSKPPPLVEWHTLLIGGVISGCRDRNEKRERERERERDFRLC